MDTTLTTGIPWLDKTIAILAAVGAICSLLSHVVSPDTAIGKAISWAAFNFGKRLSKPSVGTVTELPPPPPRGFSRIAVLIVLAVLGFAAAARADANPNALPDAIAKDPAAVQPEEPTPPAPKFGGCVRHGTVCFGPSLAVSMVAINLTTHKVEAGFAPGVGFGFTVNPGKWSSFGADAHFIIDPGAQQASASLIVKAVSGYLRFGISKGFIGDRSLRIPVGLGVDF